MFDLFKKRKNENDSCRYCKNVQEIDGKYVCRFSGEVKGSFWCRRYAFDPFAHRTPRLRTVDTTMFDPLDFKIE